MKEKGNKLDRDRPRVLGLVEQDLKQKKTSTIAVVSNFLVEASKKTDYREVADLCLILLGGEPPSYPLGQARCHSPGPLDGQEYLLYKDAHVFQGTKIQRHYFQAGEDEQVSGLILYQPPGDHHICC